MRNNLYSKRRLLVLSLFLYLGCPGPVAPPDQQEERILYIRNAENNSQICTIRPDGSDVQVIADYDHPEGDPFWEGYGWAEWSSDKSMLIVAGGPGSSKDNSCMWLMDVNGELVEKLAHDCWKPMWTHDDQMIIYRRSLGGDIFGLNITTMAVDTVLKARDPQSGDFYHYIPSDIFPENDIRLLVGETYQDSDVEIIIYDSVMQDKSYLTENEIDEGWPKVSPDGNTVAYTRHIEGSYPRSNNIYLMTAEGDSIAQITSSSTNYHWFIIWSPGSDRLAFRCNNDLLSVHIQSGAIDTLLKADEEIDYYPMDWR